MSVNEETALMPAGESVRLAAVLSALSYALDLTEGQPSGHSVRSCVYGMHIAREIGLPPVSQQDLYYALLMKDGGCSANSSTMMRILGGDDIAGKRDALAVDWTRTGWESVQYGLAHVKTHAPFIERARALFRMALNQKQDAKLLNQMRCDRGASIARRIGLSEASAEAIQCLNEHWDGLGQPQGLSGSDIPLLSRIMCIVQTVDVFCSRFGRDGITAAVSVVRKRAKRWFDPDLCRAFCSLAARPDVWRDVAEASAVVAGLEPYPQFINLDDQTLDNICLAFAEVIDAKSPFTYRHSNGVAGAAVAIGKALSMSDSEIVFLRRAGLLHDIGKLSVPNTILDKPDKLNSDEWDVVRRHPHHSWEILRRIPGFADLAHIAASHHEKLDGTGYFRHLNGESLSMPARILVVADIFDALAAKRPYRDALPLETVLGMIAKDVPRALDPSCFEALKSAVDSESDPVASLLALASAINHDSTPDHHTESGSPQDCMEPQKLQTPKMQTPKMQKS